jgi:hypothetical protein
MEDTIIIKDSFEPFLPEGVFRTSEKNRFQTDLTSALCYVRD